MLNVFVESVAKQYAFDVMPQRKVFEMFYICNGALQPKTSFGRSIVITIIIAYILRQFAVTCSTTTATATLMCFQCSILYALYRKDKRKTIADDVSVLLLYLLTKILNITFSTSSYNFNVCKHIFHIYIHFHYDTLHTCCFAPNRKLYQLRKYFFLTSIGNLQVK